MDQTGVLGDVIVISSRRDVARWAQRVAHLRTRLGTKLSLTPVVLHTGEAEAEALLSEQTPELSLFAAWAMHHRHGPKAKAVVERAIDLSSRLPAPSRQTQIHAILSVLSERMLALLKEAAMNPDKIPESPLVRQIRLLFEERGRKRGRLEGKKKGRAEGEVKGKQDALLALFKARGLSISAEQRAKLRACSDVTTLDAWIVRAATATSGDDVFVMETRRHGMRAAQRRPAVDTRRAR